MPSSSTCTSFLDLPVELKLAILHNLPTKEILSARLVNQTLKEIISSPENQTTLSATNIAARLADINQLANKILKRLYKEIEETPGGLFSGAPFIETQLAGLPEWYVSHPYVNFVSGEEEEKTRRKTQPFCTSKELSSVLGVPVLDDSRFSPFSCCSRTEWAYARLEAMKEDAGMKQMEKAAVLEIFSSIEVKLEGQRRCD